MKKLIVTMILFLSLLVGGCKKSWVACKIDAEVLTINERIMQGELIGQFMGSSSGTFKSDVIKIGVSFYIGEHLFLEDLEVQHAVLAHYKNNTTIPITVRVYWVYNWVVVYINGRRIKTISCSSELAENLYLSVEKMRKGDTND